MQQQTKVTGVILAGGRATRMNYQDKGLMMFKGQPLISYAIKALTGITQHIIINANRNHDSYSQFGYEVISDQTDSFDGPLAGVLTAMLHTDAEILLVIPCDSPFVSTQSLQKLLQSLLENKADVAVPVSGDKLQPVFLAARTALKDSLQSYLACGQRKMAIWLQQQNLVKVEFTEHDPLFININTPEELVNPYCPNNQP